MPYYRTSVLLNEKKPDPNATKAGSSYILGLWQYLSGTVFNQSGEKPWRCSPISSSLRRNLLYTGLTRAKQLAILVGTKKAIGLGVRQVKDQQRYTLLRERLIFAKSS